MTRSLAILLMFVVAVPAPTARAFDASEAPADTRMPPTATAAPAMPASSPTFAAKAEPIPAQSTLAPAAPSQPPPTPSPAPEQAAPPTPTPTPAIPVGNGVGDQAPDFRVTTTDGRTVTPAELHGKPYILYFFATW